MNTLPQISPQDWEATPASVRSLLQSLLPLVEQISQLNARVSLLEKGDNTASSVLNDETSRAKVLRYQELTDRLFLNRITPEEEAEMQRLNAELESETTPFYTPIVARMQSMAQQEAAQ